MHYFYTEYCNYTNLCMCRFNAILEQTIMREPKRLEARRIFMKYSAVTYVCVYRLAE